MYSYSINSLLVFYTVAKTKSFSKAAKILHMTQHGVSNHITQLETQTGNRLIIREKGDFKLTKEGKMIFKYAEKIEATATELEHAIRYIKKEVKPLLRIATTPVYSRIMMPFILDSFQKIYPDIMIKLDLGSSEDMIETLYSLKNDVVIAANQKVSQKSYSYPLLKEDLVLITCKDHPLSKKGPVSLR